jgi:hypothetical protein
MRENYRSDEEYFYSCWCRELKDYGFIEEWYYEKDVFEIAPEQTIGWRRVRNMTYTADFTIKWRVIPTFVQSVSETAKTGFIFHFKGISYVDVKGGGYSGKFNNSDITFPIIQKILLYEKWIWVDKFIVSNKRGSGFDKSFTPAEYLLTPTGKEKLLHYTPRTIGSVYSKPENKLLL